MNNNKVWLGLVLFCSIFLVSCATYRPVKSSGTPIEEQEKVVFHDLFLKTDLRIEDLKCERVGDGLLQVKAKIRNTQRGNIPCDIKVKFKGEDGFITDETNWMPIVFVAGEITHFMQNSLSPKAVDFVISIRYKKN